MADYIDREELQIMIKEMKKDGYDEYMFGSNYTVLDAVENAIKKLLSVDAVEVVRCKDCINYGMMHCQRDNMFITVKENDFCSSGVKKNDL